MVERRAQCDALSWKEIQDFARASSAAMPSSFDGVMRHRFTWPRSTPMNVIVPS